MRREDFESGASHPAYLKYISYEKYKFSWLDEGKNSNLFNKKWTSFGDSITERFQWQPYLISEYSLIHTNCGQGGTCIGIYSNDSLSDYAMCQQTRLTEVKNSDPDIITIMGGTNDAHYNYGNLIGNNEDIISLNKETYMGAYSFIINDLLTWKPSVKIIILGSSRDFWNSSYQTELYSDAARTVAKYYGLPFIDLYNKMGVNSLNKNYYTTDGLHPNAEGGKTIASLLNQNFISLFL